MQAPASVLVGRHELLRALFQHYRAAADWSGRMVLLSGEAGVGRTALVAGLVSMLDPEANVLRGACPPFATPRALGPLFDVADDLGLGPALRAGRRHEAFARFLDQLRDAPRPVVVVFEDVHRADEGTLDLLRVAGRRMDGTRGLLVVTFRDEEPAADHPLSRLLADLAAEPAVHRLPVPPLDARAVRLFAGDHPDPDRLLHVTGGNPAFLVELLAAGPGPGEEWPATAEEAVAARAGRLSAAARSLLETAAVVGRPAPPELLREVAGVRRAAVGECLAAGLLRPADGGVALSGDLVRVALLQRIPAARAARLHAAVLARLRDGPFAVDDPAVLAHHAEGTRDAVSVLELCSSAAEHAGALGAHPEAAAHLATALRFSGGIEPAARAGLLERRARHCYLAGRFAEARAARVEALGLRRADEDAGAEADDLTDLARLLRLSGDLEGAGRVIREAVAVLDPVPGDRRLPRALSELAVQRALAGDVEESIRLAQRSAAQAEEVGDGEGLAVGLFVAGAGRIEADEEGGLPQLERALDLALASGADDVVLGCCSALTVNAVVRRRFAEAERWFARGAESVAGRDLGVGNLAFSGPRSLQHLYEGRWREAVTLAGEGIEAPAAFYRVLALAVLGTVRARRGEPGAWPHLDQAARLAPEAGRLRAMVVRAARAEAAFIEGDLRRAEAEARAGMQAARGRGSPWILGELAYWRRQAGDPEPPPRGIAEPYALQIRGDWRAAAQRWSELGCPYEAARALLDSADEGALRAAHAALDRLDARAVARVATARLRATGTRTVPHGSRVGSRTNELGLTPREQEVLHLVAEGLTDAEIAGRLFLARKTVSHHVSAILSRLGVESRREAARLAPPRR